MSKNIINIINKYRIFFLLLSTVSVTRCLHSSDYTHLSTFTPFSSSPNHLSALYTALIPISNSPEILTAFPPSAEFTSSRRLPEVFSLSPSNITERSHASAFTPFQKNGSKTNLSSDTSLSALGLGEREKPDDNVLHENLLQKRKLKSRFDSNAPLEPIQNPYKKQKITNEEFEPLGPCKKGNSIKWVNKERVDKLYKDLQTFVQEYPFSTSTQSPEALSEIDKNRLNDVFDAISKYLGPVPDPFSDRSEFLKAFFDKLFTNVDSEKFNYLGYKLEKIFNLKETNNNLEDIFKLNKLPICTLSTLKKMYDNKKDSYKLKNIYICDHIYGFSGRAIALLGQICQSLELSHLKLLSNGTINNYLKGLRLIDNIELNTNKQQAPLPFPSSDESQKTTPTPFFNLSQQLGITYKNRNKESKQYQYQEYIELQKNSSSIMQQLKNQLKTFIKNPRPLQNNPIIIPKNIKEKEILNETFATLCNIFFNTFERKRHFDSIKSIQFLKTFLDQLFTQGKVANFNRLVTKIEKKQSVIHKNDIYIYICSRIYDFSSDTIHFLYQINKLLNLDYLSSATDISIQNSLNKLDQNKTIEKAIEKFFSLSTNLKHLTENEFIDADPLSELDSNLSKLFARYYN